MGFYRPYVAATECSAFTGFLLTPQIFWTPFDPNYWLKQSFIDLLLYQLHSSLNRFIHHIEQYLIINCKYFFSPYRLLDTLFFQSRSYNRHFLHYKVFTHNHTQLFILTGKIAHRVCNIMVIRLKIKHFRLFFGFELYEI